MSTIAHVARRSQCSMELLGSLAAAPPPLAGPSEPRPARPARDGAVVLVAVVAAGNVWPRNAAAQSALGCLKARCGELGMEPLCPAAEERLLVGVLVCQAWEFVYAIPGASSAAARSVLGAMGALRGVCLRLRVCGKFEVMRIP